MTLVEQCVQGEGLVQINVEIKVAKENNLADRSFLIVFWTELSENAFSSLFINFGENGEKESMNFNRSITLTSICASAQVTSLRRTGIELHCSCLNQQIVFLYLLNLNVL